MADYQDCPDYLQEFLFYMLTIRGRSKRTVDAYYIDLRTFLRYCLMISKMILKLFSRFRFRMLALKHSNRFL